jgi:hypothetical protein
MEQADGLESLREEFFVRSADLSTAPRRTLKPTIKTTLNKLEIGKNRPLDWGAEEKVS